MKPLFRTTSLSLVLTMAALFVAPISSFAGGGGGGSKAIQVVRIKNTSSGASTPPSTTISTVEVGDAGNAAITIGEVSYGQVADAYRIGTFEVTIQQYAAFLNSVATRPDTYSAGASLIESLYDSRMESDKNVVGISRSGAGTEASPYSYQVIGDGNRPIAYVTLFNAARFANWMHNGARSNSDLELGAYALSGANSGVLTKSDGATWWIPSEDEWFKAAYYKGGGTSAGYYRFPTASDSLPGNSSNTATNQANFRRLGLYSITQLATLSSSENYLTPVGNFVNSPSAYATFDQGGNVDEWTGTSEVTVHGTEYITRGGGWSTGGLNNDASPRSTALPTDRSSKIGFRLARSATVAGPPALSGNFEVKLANNAAPAKPLAKDEVVQFGVRSGTVTVVATDSVDPTLTAQQSITIGSKRRVFVTVSAVGNEITIAETNTPF